MTKTKKAWVIITPKGKIELDSIKASRSQCWKDYIFCNAARPLDYDAKARYIKEGYCCIKCVVVLTEEII